MTPLLGHKAWARLWSYVHVIEPDTCWVWIGRRSLKIEPPRFYFQVSGKRYRWPVRRIIFNQLYGPVPKNCGVFVMCHNSICMNPDHFFIAPKGFHTGEQMTGAFMSFEKARDMRWKKAKNPSLSFRKLAKMWDVSTGTAFKICDNQIWCEQKWPSRNLTPSASTVSTNSEDESQNNMGGLRTNSTQQV